MPKKKPTTGAGKKRAKPKPKPKPKKKNTPEKVIQANILKWLISTGLLFWRQNSGIIFAGGRAIKLGESGLPDIVIVLPPTGRVIGMEVKSAKGVQRPDQKVFQEKMESIGGFYYIVRSLADAIDCVTKTMGEDVWKAWLQSSTSKVIWPPVKKKKSIKSSS